MRQGQRHDDGCMWENEHGQGFWWCMLVVGLFYYQEGNYGKLTFTGIRIERKVFAICYSRLLGNICSNSYYSEKVKNIYR